MNSTRKTLTAFVLILTLQLVAAQDDETKKGPLTMSQALKLGMDKLTAYTNKSEAGQDEAAYLYATAKRIQTENALAQKNLQLAVELQAWRDGISKCRQEAFSLASIVNGGGTAYSHGASRDCVAVENFLTDLAKRLPLGEGKGDPKATKVIDDMIAVIKNLKPDRGDAESNNEAKADLAAEVERVTEFLINFKYEIEQIPADEAKRIATFAAGTAGWLKADQGE
jgi:hypothetical protein